MNTDATLYAALAATRRPAPVRFDEPAGPGIPQLVAASKQSAAAAAAQRLHQAALAHARLGSSGSRQRLLSAAHVHALAHVASLKAAKNAGLPPAPSPFAVATPAGGG